MSLSEELDLRRVRKESMLAEFKEMTEEEMEEEIEREELFEHLEIEDESFREMSAVVKRKLTVQQEQKLRGARLVKQVDGVPIVAFEDFEFKTIMTRGNFGKVFLAELKGKGLYAVRSMRKELAATQSEILEVTNINDAFMKEEFPFLLGTHYLYENQVKLYFISPFVLGAELGQIHKR